MAREAPPALQAVPGEIFLLPMQARRSKRVGDDISRRRRPEIYISSLRAAQASRHVAETPPVAIGFGSRISSPASGRRPHASITPKSAITATITNAM
jgi:hypothetical protein